METKTIGWEPIEDKIKRDWTWELEVGRKTPNRILTQIFMLEIYSDQNPLFLYGIVQIGRF
jgi:hypothetical protein